MRSEKNLEARLVQARVQLVLGQPFFGSLCLRLKLEPGTVPTMATDGRRILYNPDFARQLTAAELEAVLAHEVMHCALGHHCRRGQREPRMWNRAADLAINPLLTANGFRLPPGALSDAAFSGMSAEEIYAELKKQEDAGQAAGSDSPASSGAGIEIATGSCERSSGGNENPAGGESGAKQTGHEHDRRGRTGAFGEVMDAVDEQGQGASEAERLEQQRQWSVAAEQALRSAAGCGKNPAGVERPLKEGRAAKQDWRAILRDFVSARAPSDYRWSPPNRRYIAAGLYLPSVERTGLGEMVVAIDTSGSIRADELEGFAAEISAIAAEAQPERVHVVCCDAEIQWEREFASGESISVEARGGGGTDFRPVFRWVEEKGLEPACLVYLTDLRCHSFPDAVPYPVLWVTASRRKAPLGETVRMGAE